MKSMIKVDYRDANGIKRRVLVPDPPDGIDPSEGIPISLPFEQLFGQMPIDFQVRLADALFERGLIEPRDFLKPGAAELTRNALLDIVKHDALSIQSLAKSLAIE